MINLFDYATKELSQDAFLRWLFESSQEVEECGVIVGKILKEACGFEVDINKIETKAQEKNIDITVEIHTKKQQIIYVFIEDKIFSNEHRQLKKYDGYINSFPNAYKIFYKTSNITDDDKKGIKEANDENKKVNKSEWQEWDIQKIVGLFDYKANYENLILQHYIEHLRATQKNINNTKKPLSNDKNEDLVQWEGYFHKTIIPKLQGNGYKCSAWKAGQYPYICLVLTKEGYQERRIPYLEIRSRDCLNNEFIARILCYGVSAEDLRKNQQQLEINVEKVGFNHKRIIRKKKGKEIFPKQVGYTDKLSARTDEEFVKLTLEWGEKYLEALKDWE